MDTSATHCPGCGRIRDVPDPPAAKTAAIIVAVALVIAALAFLAYRGMSERLSRYSAVRNYTRSSAVTHLRVEHGAVVSVSELHGSGTLYFVPIGRQAIQVGDLAAYYQRKLSLKPVILPAVPLSTGYCDQERKQCSAEEMIFGVIRAYPKIAADKSAVVIALTDEDIYSDSLDSEFDYSFHFRRRFGIVSSYRAGLDADAHPAEAARKLANTRQILSKYIAYMYYRLPYSNDPTSIMKQPFTPNGGSDDLYESDLHSEYSSNGYWGSDDPCFGFHYSYKTGVISPIEQSVIPCTDMDNAVLSPDDETFRTEIYSGILVQRAMDFREQSLPAIEFRRGYVSRYPSEQAFGIGTTLSYNTWLTSDGPDKLTFVDVIHEDGARDHFTRSSPGKGFSPSVTFAGSDELDIYKARMSWEGGQFKLAYYDGTTATFLPCVENSDCFMSGYHDSQGHALSIERGPNRALSLLKSSDGKQIECKSDGKRRITSAKDSAGHSVTYEYDQRGDLVRVHRADGQTAVYSYDQLHNMTSFSVIRRPGVEPKLVLSNEYDTFGRVVKQKLADGRVSRIQYLVPVTSTSYHSIAIDVEGRSLNVVPTGNENGFLAKTQPVKYPAIFNNGKTKPASGM